MFNEIDFKEQNNINGGGPILGAVGFVVGFTAGVVVGTVAATVCYIQTGDSKKAAEVDLGITVASTTFCTAVGLMTPGI